MKKKFALLECWPNHQQLHLLSHPIMGSRHADGTNANENRSQDPMHDGIVGEVEVSDTFCFKKLLGVTKCEEAGGRNV